MFADDDRAAEFFQVGDRKPAVGVYREALRRNRDRYEFAQQYFEKADRRYNRQQDAKEARRVVGIGVQNN